MTSFIVLIRVYKAPPEAKAIVVCRFNGHDKCERVGFHILYRREIPRAFVNPRDRLLPLHIGHRPSCVLMADYLLM